MRKIFYLVVASICFMTAWACERRKEGSRNPEAARLYRQSADILSAYTDSISIARDSANVVRLAKACEEDMTKLNYDYPADMTLDISEAENDTLAKLTLKLVTVRDSMLQSFARKDIEDTDSIKKEEKISD